MIDHKLYATRGYCPTKKTNFSVALRGFSFGVIDALRLGIKLLSPILALIGMESALKVKVSDVSEIK